MPGFGELDRLTWRPQSPQQKADQMRAALEDIRDKAATMQTGGAWAADLAKRCLATLD